MSNVAVQSYKRRVNGHIIYVHGYNAHRTGDTAPPGNFQVTSNNGVHTVTKSTGVYNYGLPIIIDETKKSTEGITAYQIYPNSRNYGAIRWRLSSIPSHGNYVAPTRKLWGLPVERLREDD